MQVEEFLSRLDGVRPRGAGRWAALCPAHGDRNPSLSVRDGERALLLRCWAGCELTAICQALSIRVADLFFDAHVDPEAKRARDVERGERARRREQDGLRIDACREAEATVASARGIDITYWSNEQLDTALNALAGCYSLHEDEEARHG